MDEEDEKQNCDDFISNLNDELLMFLYQFHNEPLSKTSASNAGTRDYNAGTLDPSWRSSGWPFLDEGMLESLLAAIAMACPGWKGRFGTLLLRRLLWLLERGRYMR
jgi:hypothetical protein